MSQDPVVLYAPEAASSDHCTQYVEFESIAHLRYAAGDFEAQARPLRSGGALAAERAEGPAIAVVAAIGDRVVSTGLLPARLDRVNTAVIGRHSSADFPLPDAAGVSLRHLLLIVRPAALAHEIRFRVLDLRTSAGFVDEDQRRLESIEAEGPAFLWCGVVGVYLFPVGDGFAWPERTEEAMAVMPDRVYFQEVRHARGPSVGPTPPAPRRAPGGRTSAYTTGRTVEIMLDRDLVAEPPEGPDALAVLRLDTEDGRGYLALTADMLERGVLLGRYDRCESTRAGLGLGSRFNTLSRVHALVVADGGDVWLIDAASKNGTLVDGERRRATRLPRDRALDARLGSLTVRWIPRPSH